MIFGITCPVPSATLLHLLAQADRFDALFYTIQAAGLLFRGINIFLMGMNMCEGFILSGQFKNKGDTTIS